LKKLIIIFIVMLICNLLIAQNKRDYIWLFGSTKRIGLPGAEGNIIDFNKQGRIDTLVLGSPFYDNISMISDEEGRLLFYTNGCRVISWDHQFMENGDSINYGETWDKYCRTNVQGYPGNQNSIILPDPGNKDGYYLVHKRYELIFEPIIQAYIPELYHSYIDMSLNGGKGRVMRKNVPVFLTENIPVGYLSACKHFNKRDWWLIEHKKETNLHYIILLNSDTIALVDSISIGPILNIKSGLGQAVFTPDGSKYLVFTQNNGAYIYDFDRSTGRLSNVRQVVVQDCGSFQGISVSPNSRYAYLSTLLDLYQIDLWADDIQSTLTHIDHIDGFTDPSILSYFNHAQLGPDCKIYIVSGSTNNYLHVINKPDEQGKACDFKQHSIYLPNRNYNNCIPNFPHFRIDEEEICDPQITSIFGEAIFYRRDLEIFPNPSSGLITIQKPEDGSGRIMVMDMQGTLLETHPASREDDTTTLDLSHLPPGTYLIEYYPDLQKDRIFYSAKVVVAR